MVSIFAQFDDMLFARFFQPFLAFLVNRLGIARGQAACLSVSAAIAAWLLARAADVSDAVADADIPIAAFRLSVLMTGLVALLSLHHLFRRIRTVRVNPLRPTMILHRAVVLALILARLCRPAETPMVEVADLAMLTLTWAGLYLGACSEPPHGRRALGTAVSAEV